MPLPKKTKYVIIGAGIHGLSTAWKLAEKLKSGKDIVVISSKKDFLDFISKIDTAIVLDCTSHNKKTNWMRTLLKNKNCPTSIKITDTIVLKMVFKRI